MTIALRNLNAYLLIKIMNEINEIKDEELRFGSPRNEEQKMHCEGEASHFWLVAEKTTKTGKLAYPEGSKHCAVCRPCSSFRRAY